MDYNKGHRQRLKEKFSKSPSGILPDYEILEMLLFNIFPRKDTKLLAKQLLKKFGTIKDLFNADPVEIQSIDGVGEGMCHYIKLTEDLFSRLLIPQKKDFPVLSNWNAVISYCKLTMGFKGQEHFRIFYLNKKNFLIEDELLQVGTVDKVAVYPREIVKKCLYNHSSAVILVHNHPSSDPNPSRDDIDITSQISKALKTINAVVHDHLIVANDGFFSFKSNGLL